MKKILCATDSSDVTRRAEDFAVVLSRLANAELCFLHVNQVTGDDLRRPSHGDPYILEAVEAKSNEVMATLEERLRKEGLPSAACVSVRSHDVGDAIVSYAEENGYDHIVVGSNGRRGIPRFLLGSVSGAVVERAHCPVTVIR